MSQRDGGWRRRRRSDRDCVRATRCIRTDRPLNWACLRSHPDWKYLNAATDSHHWYNNGAGRKLSCDWQLAWAAALSSPVRWKHANMHSLPEKIALTCFTTVMAFTKRATTKCLLHMGIKSWHLKVQCNKIPINLNDSHSSIVAVLAVKKHFFLFLF